MLSHRQTGRDMHKSFVHVRDILLMGDRARVNE